MPASNNSPSPSWFTVVVPTLAWSPLDAPARYCGADVSMTQFIFGNLLPVLAGNGVGVRDGAPYRPMEDCLRGGHFHYASSFFLLFFYSRVLGRKSIIINVPHLSIWSRRVVFLSFFPKKIPRHPPFSDSHLCTFILPSAACVTLGGGCFKRPVFLPLSSSLLSLMCLLVWCF
jgi:hypothetical protein